MSTAADKFSRLAALRPTRSIPARAAAIRTPGEEDILGRILGAGIATNHFGEHLAIRAWWMTVLQIPERRTNFERRGARRNYLWLYQRQGCGRECLLRRASE